MSTERSMPGDPTAVPVVTVTRGAATPAELAAVLAVLLAARGAAATALPEERTRASRWPEQSRARAAFPRPGPLSWRASALPR
jgi:hypothetical protein